jgi:hypothetical protein
VSPLIIKALARRHDSTIFADLASYEEICRDPGLVYYGSPIPLSKSSLTLLAVVFDRLHFPNVELPATGFDPAAVAQEAERFERSTR